MKRLGVAAVLAIGAFSPLSIEAGMWDKVKGLFSSDEEIRSPTIRVLLVSEADTAAVEVKGHYNIYDPYTQTKLASRFGGKANVVQATKGGLTWGEEFPGVYQIKIVPDNLQKTTTMVNGIEYKGSLYIYDVDNKISVINEVDIESYVSSILSPHFDKPIAKEAMNAIVITARTDAYNATLTAGNPFWQVDADQVGYLGYAVTRKNNGVEDSVNATRDMVMSHSTPYTGMVTPFATTVIIEGSAKGASSTLSVQEAEALANKGVQADRILSRAFPEASISSVQIVGKTRRKDIADSGR